MRIRLSYKDRYLLLQALSPFETRSFPSLPRCFPRSFTFYVAHPVRSIPAFPRRKRLRPTRLRSWSSEVPAIGHVSGTLLRGAGAVRRRDSRLGGSDLSAAATRALRKGCVADDGGRNGSGLSIDTNGCITAAIGTNSISYQASTGPWSQVSAFRTFACLEEINSAGHAA